MAAEALSCLEHWARGSPRDALELLGATSECGHVRVHAVRLLASLSDEDLVEFYLPQLLVSGFSSFFCWEDSLTIYNSKITTLHSLL